MIELERPSFCTQCGAAVKGQERFCTECGASLDAMAGASAAGPVGASTPAPNPSATQTPRGPSAGASTKSPAGASTGEASEGRKSLLADSSFLMIMTVILLSVGAGVVVGKLGSGGEEITPETTTPIGSPPGNPAAVDLNSMTPAQAAERLFTRVVSAAEQGDTAQAEQFLPMAIAAHDRAEPLDHDGLFHRAILERLAGESANAIATAERILADRPTHLLALATAAEAATDIGDTQMARDYYQRFLDAYDDEEGLDLVEYEAHSGMFAGMRAAALLATGS